MSASDQLAIVQALLDAAGGVDPALRPRCVEWLEARRAELLAQQQATAKAIEANRARGDQQAAGIRLALGERAITRGTATWLEEKIACRPEAYGLDCVPCLPKIRAVFREIQAERTGKETTLPPLPQFATRTGYRLNRAST